MKSRVILISILTFCCLYAENMLASALSVTNNLNKSIIVNYDEISGGVCLFGATGPNQSRTVSPGDNLYLPRPGCDFENVEIVKEAPGWGREGATYREGITWLYTLPAGKYWYVGLTVNADGTVTSDSKKY